MKAPAFSLFADGALGVTGSPSAGWTFTKAAETGVAETVAIYTVADRANFGQVSIGNSIGTAGLFGGRVTLAADTNAGISTDLVFQGGNASDSGAVPVGRFIARIGTATNIVTRPAFSFINNGTEILSLLPLNSGANSALSWGTQAGNTPTFANRSQGTRLVLRQFVDATNVDMAVGIAGSSVMWHSLPQAIAGYAFDWFGGETRQMRLRGDGRLELNGLSPALAIGASGTGITQMRVYSQTIDPASVAANTTAEQTFTVTGLAATDKVFISKPTNTVGLGLVNARVSAADTLAITFGNFTAAPIDAGSETYTITAIRS